MGHRADMDCTKRNLLFLRRVKLRSPIRSPISLLSTVLGYRLQGINDQPVTINAVVLSGYVICHEDRNNHISRNIPLASWE
jgi:hypothetical protein